LGLLQQYRHETDIASLTDDVGSLGWVRKQSLEPDDIHRLVTAYEQTLRTLGISDRSDPITLMVAKTVIEIGQTGIRDPAQISQLAIKAIGDV
jgi:hypothetical protein